VSTASFLPIPATVHLKKTKTKTKIFKERINLESVHGKSLIPAKISTDATTSK